MLLKNKQTWVRFACITMLTCHVIENFQFFAQGTLVRNEEKPFEIISKFKLEISQQRQHRL